MADEPEPAEPAETPADLDVELIDLIAGEDRRFLEAIVRGASPRLAGIARGWSPRKIKEKMADPDFAEMVRYMGEVRDDSVEQSLYTLARSGNLGAIQMVLYNRRGTQWRDVKRIEVRNEVDVNFALAKSTADALKQLVAMGGMAALQPGGMLDEMDVIDAEVVGES